MLVDSNKEKCIQKVVFNIAYCLIICHNVIKQERDSDSNTKADRLSVSLSLCKGTLSE